MTSVMTGTETGLTVDGCPVCQLRGFALDCPTPVGEVIAVYADRDVVVFMHPPTDGVFVAPASHVQGVSRFDASALGAFLAALRRVTIQVRAVFGGSRPAISSDISGPAHSDGHICIWVAPAGRKRTGKGAVAHDPMAEAERMAKGLQ
jgi:hypothetical protein